MFLVNTVLDEMVDMNMELVHLLGDACDFEVEQPRHPAFAKVANQGRSDKIGAFAARGTTFSNAAGLLVVATPLYLARSSELQGVISLKDQLPALPTWAQFCYDKGIKSGSMRAATPYRSFCFTPTFAKANEHGKKKIDSNEDINSSRAIARARYVTEIHYARVKNWRLLAPKIALKHAHLMDATWWWAMGFSNLCQGYLRPPKACGEPSTGRSAHTTTEEGDGIGRFYLYYICKKY